MDSAKLHSAKVLFRSKGIELGDVPEVYLTSMLEKKIEIRKTDIDALLETTKHYAVDLESIADLRRLCETNLFWFAKYVLGYPDLSDEPVEGFGVKSTHGDLCNFYVHKDKTKSIKEQTETNRNRLILYPRGAFKSSVNVADTVQWIINFPNIRVLIMTATHALACAFVDDIKSKFELIDGSPSLMNQLFPEFCMEMKDLGNADRFICPMRTVSAKEPTVTASAIEKTSSGFHYDVEKADDVVSNENSETEEQCHKITRKFYLSRKLLEPFGFLEVNGTRYREFDLYGDMMDKMSDVLQIMCEPARKLKPSGYEKLEEEQNADDWYLLFPQRLTYEFLIQDQKMDYELHEGQYNQNPRPKTAILFTRPLLLKHTIPLSQIPINGPISITWDFAFGTSKGTDFSVGVVGIYDHLANLYIIDLCCGRFDPNELAQNIVRLDKIYRPMVLGIEKAGASMYLDPAIQAEAERQGYENGIKIDWFPVEQGKDIKRKRIARLHPKLMNDGLWFAATLPEIEKLYSQFELCMIQHNHEDIPDAISHQLQYETRISTAISIEGIETFNREQAAWNIIFDPTSDDRGRVGGINTSLSIETEILEDRGMEATSPCNELDSMLGAGLIG